MKHIREILSEKYYLNEAVKKTGKTLDFFWDRIKDEIVKIRIILNDDDTTAAYFEKILYAMIDSYLQGAEGYLPAASLPGQTKDDVYALKVKIAKLEDEVDSLELELDGVMFLAVDKWLDGDELKQDNTQRAAAAREVALKAIEKACAERDELKRRFNVK